jgi:predicted 3-demethylubiquinone-9 3-methyltransferase (glyoxalase superfamily)
MSLKEKALLLKEDIDEVYDAGKQAEYDAFWDAYQMNGNKNDYSYAFYNWYDEAYNPKYPIVINNGQYSADGIFTWSLITDTRVPITLRKARFAIGSAMNLHTVRLLDVDETAGDITFTNCTSLQNITITGVIPKNVNAQHSPLTPTSFKSVVKHLKNYLGTSSEYAYTLTVKTSAWEALVSAGCTDEDFAWIEETFGISKSLWEEFGFTWTDIVGYLRWNLVLAS